MKNGENEYLDFLGTKWTWGSQEDLQNTFFINICIILTIYFLIKIARMAVSKKKTWRD